MKVTPVSGTPTIAQPTSSGLSAEKISRLKAIAAGEKPEEKLENIGAVATNGSDLPSIKMVTNRNVPREVAEAPPEPTNSAVSDVSVQANAEPEVTGQLSPQFAALARQRRALQVQQRELAEKMKALEGPTRAELESRIKSQPLSVLQELGVTYEQLTNDILASQGQPQIDPEKLKAELTADFEKKLTDREQQQEQAVLAEMRRNVDSMVANGDDFELIRLHGRQPTVVELIHRIWKKNGQVLDEAEAAKLVEDELLEETLKLANAKKVQGKLTPQPAEVTAPGSTGMKTLTNRDQAKPVLGRRQRAIAAMLGQKL